MITVNPFALLAHSHKAGKLDKQTAAEPKCKSNSTVLTSFGRWRRLLKLLATTPPSLLLLLLLLLYGLLVCLACVTTDIATLLTNFTIVLTRPDSLTQWRIDEQTGDRTKHVQRNTRGRKDGRTDGRTDRQNDIRKEGKYTVSSFLFAFICKRINTVTFLCKRTHKTVHTTTVNS